MHVSAEGPIEPQSSSAPALSSAIEQINAPTAAPSCQQCMIVGVCSCMLFSVLQLLVHHKVLIAFVGGGGGRLSDRSNSDRVNPVLKKQIDWMFAAHTFDHGCAPG